MHEPFWLKIFILLYEIFLHINLHMTSRFQSGWMTSKPSWNSEKWQPSEQHPRKAPAACKLMGGERKSKDRTNDRRGKYEHRRRLQPGVGQKHENRSLGLDDRKKVLYTLAILYEGFEQVNTELATVDKKFDKLFVEMQAEQERAKEAQRLAEVAAQGVQNSRQFYHLLG